MTNALQGYQITSNFKLGDQPALVAMIESSLLGKRSVHFFVELSCLGSNLSAP